MNPEMQPRPADEKFDFSDVDAEMGKPKKPEAEEAEGEVLYDADKGTEPVEDLTEEAVEIKDEEKLSEVDRSLAEMKKIRTERQAKEQRIEAMGKRVDERMAREDAEAAEWDEKIKAAKERVEAEEAEAAEAARKEIEDITDEEAEQAFFRQGDRESAAAEAGQELDALRSEDATGRVERVSEEPLPEAAVEPSEADIEWLQQRKTEDQERIEALADVEQRLKKALGKEFGIENPDEHGAEANVSPWKRLKLGWRRLSNRDFRETWDQYQRVSNERSQLQEEVGDIEDQLNNPDAWSDQRMRNLVQTAARGVSQAGNRERSSFMGNKG